MTYQPLSSCYLAKLARHNHSLAACMTREQRCLRSSTTSLPRLSFTSQRALVSLRALRAIFAHFAPPGPTSSSTMFTTLTKVLFKTTRSLLPIADVVANGCIYVSAAGNDGNVTKGSAGVWEGPYTLADTTGLHTFGAGNRPYNRIVVDDPQLPICLHWAEPLKAPSSNYDIYVIDPVVDDIFYPTPGDVINGGHVPERSVECIGPLGSPPQYVDLTGYRLAVRRRSGASRFLRLQVLGGTTVARYRGRHIWARCSGGGANGRRCRRRCKSEQ